ncbi:MAG: SMI1/KNR4 family protein [Deltaproteobacteria bacterium]|nr:MAG: SMI1/KNR4 family protein [Deltaproteobacteria bacterium]TMQ10077.1 MAG: SMI1/KNR4 family protein [Deltaproteobacteria bacterium]
MSTVPCADPRGQRRATSPHLAGANRMHNERHPMTSDTIELVERVRRRLKEHENPCEISGPAPEADISAAEAALGCRFPPSYRTFLQTFGGIVIPPHLGIVHDFVGVATGFDAAGAPPPDAREARDVVRRTLQARVERKLADHLVVVGLGAQHQEWFCLDVSRPNSATGEYPVVLFDAKDNALDQQFYEDFGQMLAEVMGFVADNLDQPLD